MFEGISYEGLLYQKLESIPNEFDKRQGSLIYLATSANSYEMMNFYGHLRNILRQMHPQTADRKHLLMHAAQFSVFPYAATTTLVKGKFNVQIEEGTRFNWEAINLFAEEFIEEKDGYYYWQLRTEEAGYLNKPPIGRLTPIDRVQNLKIAESVEVLVPGRDEEGTEEFRWRYFKEKRWERYGGNIADYEHMTMGIEGVGGVKVTPVPEGGGTVGLTILDANYNPADARLITKVLEAIDPPGYEGMGLGLAPIDHRVIVDSAQAVTVDIELNLTFATGVTWSQMEESIKKVIENYFREIRMLWMQRDKQYVYTSYIEARLLRIDGVVDAHHTRLNGANENVSLEKMEVPILGSVTLHGTGS